MSHHHPRLWEAATPELRHLRAFLAVAETLNFTRAAERLHLAQQAVSKTVAQLEAELGVSLLVRSTREVRLTQAGEVLRDRAREVLASADAAFGAARAVGRGEAGTVRIGVSPAVGAGVVAAAVAALRRDAPALEVGLRETRPGDVEASLRSGRVEVVLARTAREADGLLVTDLAPTPAVLVVPAGHRLAGREEVSLRDLDGERVLVHSRPGTPFTDLILALCAGAGARVTPVESPVIGLPGMQDLSGMDAVAIRPAGGPLPPDLAAVPFSEEVTLPLLAIRLPDAASPAVERLLSLLAG